MKISKSVGIKKATEAFSHQIADDCKSSAGLLESLELAEVKHGIN